MTVRQLGWDSLSNGELLSRMTEVGIGGLVPADRGLAYQQNIARSGIDLVVLIARSNCAAGFDALVTMDRNIEYQQNVANAEIGVVVLRVASNRIDDLRPLAPAIKAALVTLRPGQTIHVGTERRPSGRHQA